MSHRRSSIIPMLLLLLLLGLAAASWARAAPGAPGPVCTVDGGGGADHSTVAAAIADANCEVIQVAAGTYTENLDIDRDLALQGASPSSTILDGNGTVTHQRVISITDNQHVSISGLTIQNGCAPSGQDGGGGILNHGALTLSNVILTHNTVTGTLDGDAGGAISSIGSASGRLVLRDCVVSHNTARRGGGVFFNDTLLISNTLFYSNTAFVGGGLCLYGPTQLVNVTLSGNHALNGSGIRHWVTTTLVSLVNCTVAGNTGSYGITSRGGLTLANTILAHNPAGNCSSAMASAGHNLDSGDTCGLGASGDLTDTLPLLGPLQDNGGPSPTHALLAGSPAIDSADSALCPATDQRGWMRPIDGNDDGSAICDRGAYEAPRRVHLPLVLREASD